MTEITQLVVFDLPQIYQRPSWEDLMEALGLLEVAPPVLGTKTPPPQPPVFEEGVANYLTNIIKSPLTWIKDEGHREQIQDLAGRRLSERSGRVALPTMSRTFKIQTSGEELEISLNEPTITSDDLGLKTWAASCVLANRLHRLENPTVPRNLYESDSSSPSVLELGSGTGLLGLAAAAVWKCHVLLTDLQPIADNLWNNLWTNARIIQSRGGMASSAVLDWNEPSQVSHCRNVVDHCWEVPSSFKTILAADSIYSSSHPRFFAQTVRHWLADGSDARVILAYPLREGYEREIEELRKHLRTIGLYMLEEGAESAQDDWQHAVLHSWSVWGWASYRLV
ncbi:MAG: hypothetical protein M1831_004541 [Alyxoria varia]|nr:MAG: hypothetical protein M1831_004541 [Alyxoria varia]